MKLRTLLLAIGATAALAVIAACAPSWVVRSQATPDPFLNRRDFVLLPVAFAGVHVGSETEEEYLAKRSPQDQRAFFEIRTAFTAEYVRTTVAAARERGIHLVTGTLRQAPPFVIQPVATAFDLGAGDRPSEVTLLVRLLSVDGTVLDTIDVSNRSSMYAAHDRLMNDGGELGRRTAAYLETRVGPPGPSWVAPEVAPQRDAGGSPPSSSTSPDPLVCWTYLVVAGADLGAPVPPAFRGASAEDLASFGAAHPYLSPFLGAAGPSTPLTATGSQLGALAWRRTSRFVKFPNGPSRGADEVVEISVPPQTSTVGFRFALPAAGWLGQVGTGEGAGDAGPVVGPNVGAFPEPVRNLMAAVCAHAEVQPIVVVDATTHVAVLFP